MSTGPLDRSMLLKYSAFQWSDGTVMSLKVAVQERAWVIDTTPVAQPSPDHPAKTYPRPGCAVRVTDAPESNSAAHVPPHATPVGELVTVPALAPVPLLATVSDQAGANVAVQPRAALTVTTPSEQSASPDQPANRDPAAAIVVSVTTVPRSKVVPQVPPQSRPAGVLVTVPLPAPALVTVTA